METIKTIEELIESYEKLPGIGPKTAERLAYATLSMSVEDRESFCNALQNSIHRVSKCPDCGTYFEDSCPICSNPNRDTSLLMVVSDSKDIISIEKSGSYNGLYFTLDGTLSPVKNRTPDSIGIPKLKEIVKSKGVHEIILALPTDLEGETTSLFIINSFAKYEDVSVTRLAHGIPIGTNLEYIDSLTLAQSIKGRVSTKGDKGNE